MNGIKHIKVFVLTQHIIFIAIIPCIRFIPVKYILDVNFNKCLNIKAKENF
jgi:hypothetical protein